MILTKVETSVEWAMVGEALNLATLLDRAGHDTKAQALRTVCHWTVHETFPFTSILSTTVFELDHWLRRSNPPEQADIDLSRKTADCIRDLLATHEVTFAVTLQKKWYSWGRYRATTKLIQAMVDGVRT